MGRIRPRVQGPYVKFLLRYGPPWGILSYLNRRRTDMTTTATKTRRQQLLELSDQIEAAIPPIRAAITKTHWATKQSRDLTRKLALLDTAYEILLDLDRGTGPARFEQLIAKASSLIETATQ